jgi:hypothetical protein
MSTEKRKQELLDMLESKMIDPYFVAVGLIHSVPEEDVANFMDFYDLRLYPTVEEDEEWIVPDEPIHFKSNQ